MWNKAVRWVGGQLWSRCSSRCRASSRPGGGDLRAEAASAPVPAGVLVEDLLALHDGEQGSPIIFGCETKETGEIYKQRADGLFGLGNSDVSVINQVRETVAGHLSLLAAQQGLGGGWWEWQEHSMGAEGLRSRSLGLCWPLQRCGGGGTLAVLRHSSTQSGARHTSPHLPACARAVVQLVNAGVIDNVFSLCFGTVEGEGAMLLGDAPMPRGLRLQYTPLISSLQHPFYYNVRLAGLSVAGQRLSLDQVGAAGGGSAVLWVPTGRVGCSWPPSAQLPCTAGHPPQHCMGPLRSPWVCASPCRPTRSFPRAELVPAGLRHGAGQRHHLHLPAHGGLPVVCGGGGAARADQGPVQGPRA